jgi:hypothetical protein
MDLSPENSSLRRLAWGLGGGLRSSFQRYHVFIPQNLCRTKVNYNSLFVFMLHVKAAHLYGNDIRLTHCETEHCRAVFTAVAFYGKEGSLPSSHRPLFTNNIDVKRTKCQYVYTDISYN